jgi:hypothetical protein
MAVSGVLIAGPVFAQNSTGSGFVHSTPAGVNTTGTVTTGAGRD